MRQKGVLVMTDLMHVFASCPRCNSGVMTPYAILKLVNGYTKTELISRYSETHNQKGEFIQTICSLDKCGYSETLATPTTLLEHKKKMRTHEAVGV